MKTIIYNNYESNGQWVWLLNWANAKSFKITNETYLAHTHSYYSQPFFFFSNHSESIGLFVKFKFRPSFFFVYLYRNESSSLKEQIKKNRKRKNNSVEKQRDKFFNFYIRTFITASLLLTFTNIFFFYLLLLFYPTIFPIDWNLYIFFLFFYNFWMKKHEFNLSS